MPLPTVRHLGRKESHLTSSWEREVMLQLDYLKRDGHLPFRLFKEMGHLRRWSQERKVISEEMDSGLVLSIPCSLLVLIGDVRTPDLIFQPGNRTAGLGVSHSQLKSSFCRARCGCCFRRQEGYWSVRTVLVNRAVSPVSADTVSGAFWWLLHL